MTVLVIAVRKTLKRKPIILRRAAVAACCAITSWFGSSGAFAARPNSVTVSAGTVDRANSIVTFPTDADLAGSFQELAPDGGRPLAPLEVGSAGAAWFILQQ